MALTPQMVDPSGSKDFSQIAVGDYTICAVRGVLKDEVWCWGENQYGGLGSGTIGDVATLPQRVTLAS